jgi:glycosyltransferase involved in cell wall biosynthesis
VAPLTVVIPTHNRAGVLKRVLLAYRSQSAPELIEELIVVDDGSTDNTEAVVMEARELSPFPVRYLRQANKGPAAARNYGIREARAPVILFTDSDVAPAPCLVSKHLATHDKHPSVEVAVLGYVGWPTDPKPTPFMAWYGEHGALFSFGKFRSGQQLTFLNFYTCNLSLKTEFLRTHGHFDEEFKSAAYEDIELGYRLGKAGLRLLYNAEAVGYHHQYFFFKNVCEKARRNAAATRLFGGKEAGRCILEQQRRRKSGLGYKIGRAIAIGLGAILSPFRSVLDSRVQLPSVIYHLLFWYHVTRSSDLSESRDRAF